MKHTLPQLLPAVLWSAFIFIICFLPGNSLPAKDWLDAIHFDKLVHAFSYAVLAVLILRIFTATKPVSYFLTFAICFAQGILIEFIQDSDLIQNRSFDLNDIYADVLGTLAGLVAYALFKRRCR
jgi:hypothetical protein